MTNLLYVGTDQSLSNAGIAVWCPKTKKIAVYKASTKAEDDIWDRLIYIERAVSEAWSIQDSKVEYLFSESPTNTTFSGSSRGTNTNTIVSLARLEASIVMGAKSRGSSTVQMGAGNKKDSWFRQLGCESSKAVFKAALGDWLPDYYTLDESDAIGVLWGGLSLTGVVQGLEDIFKNEPVRLRYNSKRPKDFTNQLQSALGLYRVPKEVLAPIHQSHTGDRTCGGLFYSW